MQSIRLFFSKIDSRYQSAIKGNVYCLYDNQSEPFIAILAIRAALLDF